MDDAGEDDKKGLWREAGLPPQMKNEGAKLEGVKAEDCKEDSKEKDVIVKDVRGGMPIKAEGDSGVLDEAKVKIEGTSKRTSIFLDDNDDGDEL